MSAIKRRLRPMGIVDLLDETVDLFKSNFALLVGVATILYVPISVIDIINTRAIRQSAGVNWSFLWTILPEALVTAALTFAVSERYLGRDTSIGQCYARIFKSKVAWPFIGAVLIKYAFVFTPFFLIAGIIEPMAEMGRSVNPSQADIIRMLEMLGLLMAAVIWMICFEVKLMLVEPSLIVESCGPLQAISRSWKLMKKNYWKGFGIYFTVVLVFLLIALMLLGPVSYVQVREQMSGKQGSYWVDILSRVLIAIVSTMTIPVLGTAKILFYYDVRIRKDGFDIEILANELGQGVKGDAGEKENT
ncbi:MAG: glycerophosphoryl diester phosphodiesterase membrane domain-containing protein [Armatimonadetes bacterium]|nr:glycerophosphoryl diester phosphodiesterase membrane domain-containing protein [Armatimonadota bacterium]